MKQQRKTLLLSGFIIILIFVFGYFIGTNANIDAEVPTNINTVITFIVSIIALIFAMITYFSIDAVDKKNRMENNILQAEKYRPAYQAIMKQLNTKTEEAFEETLKEAIRCPKIYTCMQYADWVQKVIDYIIFMAYLKNESSYYEELISMLNKHLNKYEGIGSEIDILLRENVSLIDHVLNYQKYRKDNAYYYSSLEDVRGEMLGNPNSRIVYYDYLGLDYRRLASKFMMKDFDGKEFSEQYFVFWKEKKEFDDKDKCVFFINLALKSFEKALEESNNDMIWEGYIQYNVVRTKIMNFLCVDEEKQKDIYTEVIEDLEKCVTTRQNICYLFAKEGYLQEQFEKEKILAQKLRDAFISTFDGF